MLLLLQFLFIILAFISNEHEATAVSYTTLVIPVSKHTDAAKPLYSVQIGGFNNQNKNFIIDFDAPLIWYDCTLTLDFSDCPSGANCASPLECYEDQCSEVRNTYAYKSLSCPTYRKPSDSWIVRKGGHYQVCTCQVYVVNPVTDSCTEAPLDYDEFTVRLTDGRNVLNNFDYFTPNAACVTPSTLASFPANVSGVFGLSSSLYAFPGVYHPYQKQFAICIPSGVSSRGVLFYGTGPFYLLPQSNVDVTSYLSYTPLLKRQDSFGYFINVSSIVIKKRSITVPTNVTTKLSTIDPYTVLRTDIYNGVVRRFSLVTKRLPPAKPVAPFGLCFGTSTTGLRVPDIDFNLPDGKKWTVSTANSITQVTNDVACLAFVDGGAKSEPAIVIGSFQLEDNFLVFDAEKSILGFSSSLQRKKTSCANFNFTITV